MEGLPALARFSWGEIEISFNLPPTWMMEVLDRQLISSRSSLFDLTVGLRATRASDRWHTSALTVIPSGVSEAVKAPHR